MFEIQLQIKHTWTEIYFICGIIFKHILFAEFSSVLKVDCESKKILIVVRSNLFMANSSGCYGRNKGQQNYLNRIKMPFILRSNEMWTFLQIIHQTKFDVNSNKMNIKKENICMYVYTYNKKIHVYIEKNCQKDKKPQFR